MDEANDENTLKARPYQEKLEEIALQKNTIIYLPTGSGKTYIAICLLKRFRHSMEKPWGQGGERAFFLVNNVPLVKQQQNVIQKLSPFSVGGYSGADNVDYWKKDKWDEELSKYQVIVMTCQILADMLTHSYIAVENINIMIFDECHHAIEDHPMRLIMKHFVSCPVSKQPRVVGLTATLLNANVKSFKEVKENLKCLETTFHATIATVNELDEVLCYSTNPNECLVTYQVYIPTMAADKALSVLHKLKELILSVKLPEANYKKNLILSYGQKDITTDDKKVIKGVSNMVQGMIDLIMDFGVYGGSIGIVAYQIAIERLKRKAVSKEEELLYGFTITHSLQARMILLEAMKDSTGYEQLRRHSSDKILKFINILKEYNPEFNRSGNLKINISNLPLSGIVFVKQRFPAKVLYNIVKELVEMNPLEFGFLKHEYMVGFNLNPFNNTREQHFIKKKCQQALLRFGNKELNCMISTSILEEGIDIPQCTLVMCCDLPFEYRSYVQSKGRARSSAASYVIMVPNNKMAKFNVMYSQYLEIEQYIKDILVGHFGNRVAPTEIELQKELYDADDIQPYVAPNGNRLSATQAISLLNRYCSTLPHDKFTIITPMWVQELTKVYKTTYHVEKKYVNIHMPIACPIKTVIRGSPMYTTKNAKRSAALEACIRLHKIGELDEKTLLPKAYAKVDFDHPDIKEIFLNWPWDGSEDNEDNMPRPGTKKRMRKHKRMYPSCLSSEPTWEDNEKTFYLHVIELKTLFDRPTDPKETALYDLLHNKQGFGFLTTNPLPKICDFPMFLTVGEVQVTIKTNFAVINLDMMLFDLVKEFHYFLYKQVLEVAKNCLTYDGTENCMYTVPIVYENADCNIDWNTMQEYKEIQPIAEPSSEEKKKVNVCKENYQYYIVSPWYRETIRPPRYLVSNVLEYKTPMSYFDGNDFTTYEEYYSSKYNLNIVGRKDQPMLEVRNITSGMNCLLPRAATINKFSDKQKKVISEAQGEAKIRNFTEYLIPEFCIKYEFPGVLWFKAMILPSIVHRVTMLLIANDLRVEMVNGTTHGKNLLNEDEDWLPPIVDIKKVQKSLHSQTEGPVPTKCFDRINNPIGDNAPKPLRALSMKESLYKLQQKKIDNEYPWQETMEPVDIERSITSVTLMDIECYDEFVTASMSTSENKNSELKANTTTPHQSNNPAILPPPLKIF